jgi:lysophospholipase L1-like esterase
MNILFIGDSITRGTQGVDWVKMIENEHPYWTIENAGVNGETLNKIFERLKTLLQINNSYRTIVLQTATSDILLPTFKHRNFWFQQDYKRQLKSGNQPAAPADFEIILERTVEYIRSSSNSEIVLPTLGCINENLLAETNAQLFSYNSIIKKIAKDFNCILADVSERFQEELSHLKTQDYCLDNFSNTAFLDLLSCSMGMVDNLSAKRKLHLTIDGVHLNSRGAKIFKEEVDKAILLTKEKSALFI